MGDSRHPAVVAASRVLAVVVAALIVAVGFFEESFAYALAVGLAVGAAFAVIGYVRDRLDEEGFDHS